MSLSSTFGQCIAGCRLTINGTEEILKTAGIPTELFLEVLEAHRRARVSSTFSTDHAACLDQLRAALNGNQLTLCLGAGVSFPNRIPTWNTLLTRVAQRALSTRDFDLFSRVTATPHLSALVLGRFLKTSFTIAA
jgi:hypothetical protein